MTVAHLSIPYGAGTYGYVPSEACENLPTSEVRTAGTGVTVVVRTSTEKSSLRSTWNLATSDIGVLPDIGAPDIGKTPIS